ncbi:MAG TPA: peptidylprolyl isomerase [Thermotogota bacterium]|nr:peptidylprolyl isomerase [Thermotogota bacterium]
MSKAKMGDTVQVHYTGSLEDGTQFDTSLEREPLEFKIGGHQVIPGFENAVIGMEKGEKTTIRIPPEEGYGEYDEKLRFIFDKSQFPNDLELEPGLRLNVPGEGGKVALFTVVDILGDEVILDGNHPLVGQTLIFDLELVGIL